MKKLTAYITIFVSALVISTTAAEARSNHSHSSKKAHSSSQYITTYKKVFSHYSRCGQAIYTYRKVIVRKSTPSHRNHHRYNRHQPQKSTRGNHYSKAKSHRR